IGLLPDQLLSDLLHECADQGGSSYDLIGGLFRQMATEQPAPAGRYKGVQYFNGDSFAVVDATVRAAYGMAQDVDPLASCSSSISPAQPKKRPAKKSHRPAVIRQLSTQ